MAVKRKGKGLERENDSQRLDKLERLLGDALRDQIESLRSLELALRETEIQEQIIRNYAFPCHHLFKAVRQMKGPRGKPKKPRAK